LLTKRLYLVLVLVVNYKAFNARFPVSGYQDYSSWISRWPPLTQLVCKNCSQAANILENLVWRHVQSTTWYAGK